MPFLKQGIQHFPWPPIICLIYILPELMGEACVEERQCGWNAYCKNGTCECIPGFRWTKNVKDCYDTKCSDTRCLACSTKTSCRRCVDFVESGTGKCLDECDTSYVFMVEGNQVGRVCSVSTGDEMMTLYIAIIIGVSAGIILTTLIALAFYWKLRSDNKKDLKGNVASVNGSRRGNLGNKNRVLPLSNGHVTAQKEIYPVLPNGHTNHAYDQTNADYTNRIQEHANFLQKVAALRPHSETFVEMLTEAKQKVRVLPPEDNRVYVYKNIIHQLCRVLTIMNSEDNQILVPPDGESLMSWAEKILQKYHTVQQTEQDEESIRIMSPSQTGTMSSTFRPDQQLAPNGATTNQASAISNATTTTRNPPQSTQNEAYSHQQSSDDDAGYRNEVLTLQSLSVMLISPEEFTEPIEV